MRYEVIECDCCGCEITENVIEAKIPITDDDREKVQVQDMDLCKLCAKEINLAYFKKAKASNHVPAMIQKRY